MKVRQKRFKISFNKRSPVFIVKTRIRDGFVENNVIFLRHITSTKYPLLKVFQALNSLPSFPEPPTASVVGSEPSGVVGSRKQGKCS